MVELPSRINILQINNIYEFTTPGNLKPQMLLSMPMGVDYVVIGFDKEVRHGNTTISYPQCSLTFLHERYLYRCREQSLAIRAHAMSAVGIDVVSSHMKYCRITYGIIR